MDKEKIRQEAKEIIDSFAEEIDKIDDLEEARVEREKDRREEKDKKEGEEREGNEDFKDKMLENAPKTKGDYIKSETGGWEG